MVNEHKLDFWFKNGLNVLFVGKHGVGKTAVIKNCFERNGLVLGESFLYFSASTLDPWVDFIGVPKEVKDENGIIYLDLVRPKPFAQDKVVAIFLDEFSRSNQKIRNAAMELIQFKSINGKKFPHLKVVWAAINPSSSEEGDESYDVEQLDPAQEDRFQIKVEIPYKPSQSFFYKKYGENVAKAAISWWDDLPEEQKRVVSPRRLDYALEVNKMEGDIRDVLPFSSNPGKLIQFLSLGPIKDRLKVICDNRDESTAREFLANENNYANSINHILQSALWRDFFIPFLPKEKIAVLIFVNPNLVRPICQRASKIPVFNEVLNEIVAANANYKLVNQIKKYRVQHATDDVEGSGPIPPFFVKNPYYNDYNKLLQTISSSNFYHQSERNIAYNQLRRNIPQIIMENEAVVTLQILQNLISHSYKITIDRWNCFMGMVNHCLETIYSRSGKEGYNSQINIRPNLVSKLRQFGLWNRRFVPPGV